MNVVLYLRYSSDKQNEQSIEGQRRICEEYCQRNDMKIVDVYIDRALSASKDIEKRTDFQRMIKDSEKNDFEAVIVYKLDRFARNRYDSATYKNKLKKNGVRVISATENISDNPEGVILEAVLEGMAEFYSKELSQKVTRGMNETALKGNSCGGTIPLGYKVENKKLVIDPLTAPIVVEAFERYAAGEKLKDICESFNNRGLRTPKGGEFNKNTFSLAFKNEKYIGVYKYKNVRIENAVPALIEKDVFEKVQMRVEANKIGPARSKAKVDYLLSGKLYCGHCNALMSGSYGTSATGEKYYYYICNTKKKNHSCDKKNVKKEWIEDTVLEDVLSSLTEDVINQIADTAEAEAKRLYSENADINMYKRRIEETEKGIANIVKFVEKGSDSEALFQRLGELEKQKKQLQAQLEEISKDFVLIEREFVIWWLNQFVNGDLQDPQFKKIIFELLIDTVTVFDEPDGWYTLRITYNVTSLKSKTLKSSNLDCAGSPTKSQVERDVR